MSITKESLQESTQRVVRVVGRDLLSKVLEKSENLGVEEERDAVHDFRVALRRLRSWLRAFDDELSPTVRPKVARRLKRIADSTRVSRDCEVHIEWLEDFANGQRGKYRRATQWLVDDLRAEKSGADLELLRAVDKDLERTAAGLRTGLSHYIVDLDEPVEPMALRLAKLIRNHAATAATRLAAVTSVGDRAEAHEARIAVKRLRYIIEPLVGMIDGAESLVDDLSKLQDELGALHDAQIFGSEIATRLAKVLAAVTPAAAGDEVGDEEEFAANDRADALRAISRRLHREELRAFESVVDHWLGGAADGLWRRTDAIAAELEAVR
jgi:CHAD domain-containing protein